MSVDQASFDADLQAFIAAVGTLITAIEAWIAAHPGPDLSAEDQQVKDAADQVQEELAKITSP